MLASAPEFPAANHGDIAEVVEAVASGSEQ